MDFFIDRSSGVPIRRQIRGTIEYAIACGDLAIGAGLPSVRDLAEQLGVAPMTISQAYNDLKRDGLIEARSGSGTFVADSARAQMATRPDIDSLHHEIDRLIDFSEGIGVQSGELASLVNNRIAYRSAVGRRASIVVAGLFPEATKSYARNIALRMGDSATVRPVTLEGLQNSLDLKPQIGAADLIVTFSNLRGQISNMFPATKVVAIRFIPSEETRRSLAGLDPMSRLAVVSKFHDFLPILKSGVQRFASHVLDMVSLNEDSAEAPALLADRNVIVYATGADAIAGLAPEGAALIEYRHIPEPRDVDRVVQLFAGGREAETIS